MRRRRSTLWQSWVEVMCKYTNNFVVLKLCRNIWQQHARKRKLLVYASRPLYEKKKTWANYRMPARREPPLIAAVFFPAAQCLLKSSSQWHTGFSGVWTLWHCQRSPFMGRRVVGAPCVTETRWQPGSSRGHLGSAVLWDRQKLPGQVNQWRPDLAHSSWDSSVDCRV